MRTNRPSTPRWLAALFGALSLPSIADAHLVTTGLGPVYDGIGHLVLTPQDFIAVLALCLFAGQLGTAHSRMTLLILPIVWFLAGRLIGFELEGPAAFPYSAISFIVLGILVAANVTAKPWVICGLAVALGVTHGVDNGMALRDSAGTRGLLGIAIGLFVIVSLVTATVVSMRKPWMRIVVRVAGSWIVATGVMMLGWHYRPVAEPEVAQTSPVPSVPQELTLTHLTWTKGQR